MSAESCLACAHVARDAANAAFVCREQAGPVAACSETCLSFSQPGAAKMVPAHSITAAAHLPFDMACLPTGCAMRRGPGGWRLGYFEDSSAPLPGEFRLAPEGHPARNLTPQTQVAVWVLETGLPVTVGLGDEARVLPFWSDLDECLTFAPQLKGAERPVLRGWGEVRAAASMARIWFASWNYLCEPADWGVITALGPLPPRRRSQALVLFNPSARSGSNDSSGVPPLIA